MLSFPRRSRAGRVARGACTRARLCRADAARLEARRLVVSGWRPA